MYKKLGTCKSYPRSGDALELQKLEARTLYLYLLMRFFNRREKWNGTNRAECAV